MRTKIGVLLVLGFSLGALRAENWPRFRGPTGQGISSERDLAIRWDARRGVLWKTALPGEAWSSPIVWEGRVFLTTAADAGESCRVLSVDAETGKILWAKEVCRQALKEKNGKNSWASSTPVTDGDGVFAVFSDGSIAALSLSGELRWINRDVRYYSHHGLGASPILHGDLLIMPFDGCKEGEKEIGWKTPWEEAFILAVETKSGKERWRAKRGPSRIAHVTPNVLRWEGRDVLVSGAGDVIQGFDLSSGERLWSAASQGEGVVPSIVLGESLVYAPSGFEAPTIRAVRPGGSGEVTKTHLAWEQRKGVPSIPSLLYVKPHLYSIVDAGVVTCFDAESGEILKQARIGGSFSASPVWAEGRIYLLSEQGETTVLAEGPELEVLARNPIGERCQASLAVSGGRIFIRSEKHLWAIGRSS